MPSMRGGRLLLAAIPFGVAVLAPASAGRATGAWPTRLPASITIEAGRATFRIERDGRVRRVAAAPSAYPKAASYFPGTGTWYKLSRHRLMVGRGHKALWRSNLQIPSRWRLGLVAVGPHGVAFQFVHQLYMASLGGVEHPVARREMPVGWTAAGLYAYAYQGRQLELRSATGRLLEVIARRPLQDFFVADGRLYFIVGGVLMSASGTRIKRLASLRRLGLSAVSWMEPLGRLTELQDDHRLVVVRADGSVFASIQMPPVGQGGAALVGLPAVSERAGLLAFTTVTDQSASRRVGTETVYLLRSGANQARPVYTHAGDFGGCARWVNLQWHGRWLLYSANQGYLAVIGGAGRHGAIRLTSFARRLPGAGEGLNAHWTGQPPM